MLLNVLYLCSLRWLCSVFLRYRAPRTPLGFGIHFPEFCKEFRALARAVPPALGFAPGPTDTKTTRRCFAETQSSRAGRERSVCSGTVLPIGGVGEDLAPILGSRFVVGTNANEHPMFGNSGISERKQKVIAKLPILHLWRASLNYETTDRPFRRACRTGTGRFLCNQTFNARLLRSILRYTAPRVRGRAKWRSA